MQQPFDTTPPPPGFSSGPLYSKPLRVYFQGNKLWLYDDQGFLCSIPASDIYPSQLLALLKEEASSPVGTPDRPHYRHTARGMVVPGFDLEREAKAKELAETVQKAAGTAKQERAQVVAKAGGIDLASLGLMKPKPG